MRKPIKEIKNSYLLVKKDQNSIKNIKANPSLVLQSVEAVILLPQNQEFPDLGVTEQEGPHIITAGSKGQSSIFHCVQHTVK